MGHIGPGCMHAARIKVPNRQRYRLQGKTRAFRPRFTTGVALTNSEHTITVINLTRAPLQIVKQHKKPYS